MTTPTVDLDEVNNIRRACAARLDLPLLLDADQLTDQQAIAVLSWWHAATGGLKFSSHWVGTVGVRAYHWQRAKAGADARGVDGVRRLDSDLAAAMTADLALHLDWVNPDALHLVKLADRLHWNIPASQRMFLTELDVNGQFLAAAGCDLGTGEPDLIPHPRTIDAYLPMPGYVRLAEKPDLDGVITYPRAFDRLDAGGVIAMPTARYLRRRGAELDADEVLIWPKHRRHLAAWQAIFRNARANLALAAKRGNMPALIALCLVKEVANVTLGGWLRSADKNTSDLMRKDWSDQLISEGVVRELISLDKAAAAGNPAVGMRRDAAWFIGPAQFEPVGLEIDKRLYPNGRDGQLGKWKRTRCMPVDQSLLDAFATGSPEMVVRVLTAWEREMRGH